MVFNPRAKELNKIRMTVILTAASGNKVKNFNVGLVEKLLPMESEKTG